jgi:hypothetical protein
MIPHDVVLILMNFCSLKENVLNQEWNQVIMTGKFSKTGTLLGVVSHRSFEALS